MNAHSEGLKRKTREEDVTSAVRSECEQMLRIIDEQLADLEQITQQLRQKRREWAAKVEVGALAEVSRIRKRAPRGSVRALIFRELGAEPAGLDGVSLTNRIAAVLPVMNRHSVTVALNKLAQQQQVALRDGKWKLM